MVSLPNHRTMNGQLNLINIPVLNTVRSFDWLRTNGAAPERVNGPAARTKGSNLILLDSSTGLYPATEKEGLKKITPVRENVGTHHLFRRVRQSV